MIAPTLLGLILASAPNIVLIVVDDLGWGDLGCYGSALHQTPAIDGLAAEGVRFTDAYAAGPVCSPTRAAILTGRTPAALGITDWIPGRRYPAAPVRTPEFAQALSLDERTTAEALRAAGYVCLHVGKWHLGGEPYWPRAQGFDVNVGGHDKGAPASYFHPYRSLGGDVDWSVRNLPPGGREGDYLTDRLTTEAIGLIEVHHDRPFFLHLSFYAVHTPIEGRPDLVARYRSAAPDLPDRRLAYAAMVHAVDENVGRVLAALDRLEIDRRTLVILTSDNGGVEGLADNGPFRAGKGHLYEGGLRVPLIVRWPGRAPAGATCGAVTSSIDLHPTILAAAGVGDDGRTVEGVDLTPALADPAAALHREAVFWHYPHYHTPGRPPSGAVRLGDLKLIERYEDDRLELYDLAQDPAERHDLAVDRPEEGRRLRARLDDWRRRVGAARPEPNPDHDPDQPFAGGFTAWNVTTPGPVPVQ